MRRKQFHHKQDRSLLSGDKILAGALSLVIILKVIDVMIHDTYASLLWFCFINLLLLATGLFLRSAFLISSAAISSLVLEFLWLIDLIVLIFGGSFTGSAAYLLSEQPLSFILTFYHIFLLIIPLVILKKEKNFRWKALILSSLLLLFISLITLPTGSNINCVRELCGSEYLSGIYSVQPQWMPTFIFHWLFLTFIIFTPTTIVLHFVFNRYRKKHINKKDSLKKR